MPTGTMRGIVAVAAALTTAACFSSTTTVRVRPDGSGTIHVTSLVRKAALVQLDAMVASPGVERGSARVDEWFPEHEARDAAAGLGGDVRFVSTRPIDNDEALGRVTVYEFGDIRRVTLEPIPLLPAEGSSSASARLVGEHRFTFDLVDQPENGLVLTARLPDADLEHAGVEQPAGQPEAPSGEHLAALRRLAAGGRLEVAIEPELPILRTNTPHRDGQRITLVRLDAEPLLLDETIARRLVLQPGSLDELRYRLHDAPGVTVSLDREIRIELTRQ